MSIIDTLKQAYVGKIIRSIDGDTKFCAGAEIIDIKLDEYEPLFELQFKRIDGSYGSVTINEECNIEFKVN